MGNPYKLDTSPAIVLAICKRCGSRVAGLSAAEAVRLIRAHQAVAHDTRGKSGN